MAAQGLNFCFESDFVWAVIYILTGIWLLGGASRDKKNEPQRTPEK